MSETRRERNRSPSASRSGAVLIEREASSSSSILRRSWFAVADLLSPFSHSALAKLPDTTQRERTHETRADRIPEEAGAAGVGSTIADGGGAPNGHRDYGATGVVPVRVPKKIATPIRVEGKVWFANERTWLSYLNMAVLLGTLALALFNASDDSIAQLFALVYALISIGVLIYGWAIYQKRITMIRKRDPGHFDQIHGPLIICACLFFAVLSNFIIRVQDLKRKTVPIPDD